jgi:hypothetical protein
MKMMYTWTNPALISAVFHSELVLTFIWTIKSVSVEKCRILKRAKFSKLALAFIEHAYDNLKEFSYYNVSIFNGM